MKLLTFAIVVACLLRAPVKAYQIRWVAAGAAALLLYDLYVIVAAQLTPDYHIFWRVGRDLWEGLDPYDPARFATDPFLNPPTALPLFALFALAAYLPSLVVWTLANVLFGLTLPRLTERALSAQARLVASQPAGACTWRALPPRTLAALTSTLLVSDAFSYGLFTGQLGLLTAVALMAALDSQGRGRPIAAGLWLGLATIKVSTMLPFLLLFLRKPDRRTWITFGLACSAFCVLGGSPALLPRRVSWTLQQIEALSAPGQVNDYSFLGTQNATMIGFDHALYRLGLRNRATIRNLQLIAVGLMGLWLARLALSSHWPRPAVCSLVTLYSVLFFYHRNYDTIVLLLPLVYSATRAQTVEGRSRWQFVASSIAIVLVWFLSAWPMKSLTEASLTWGFWGRLVQATVTSYATWMILVAMACIYLADVRQLRPGGPRSITGT